MLKVLTFIIFFLFSKTSLAVSEKYNNLFIGDSNIDLANIKNLFADINATYIPRYGGDTFMIIDNLNGIEPYLSDSLENIYILVGTNDLFVRNADFKTIYLNLNKIFDYLTINSNAKLHLYELLPRTTHKENIVIKDYNLYVSDNLKNVNEYNVNYVEIFSEFYDESINSKNSTLYSDAIHLNQIGQTKLREITLLNIKNIK